MPFKISKIAAIRDAPSHYVLGATIVTSSREVLPREFAALIPLRRIAGEHWSRGEMRLENGSRRIQVPDRRSCRVKMDKILTRYANDTVQFESITPESYSVSYNVSRPGIIFVSQTFYPGWVTDNERIKLIEVFGAFQGLVIPEAGQGRVVARFSPSILRNSLVVSIFSLMATLAVVRFGTWKEGSDPGMVI